MKIVADDKIPFLKGILEPYGTVCYIPGQKITSKDVVDADALIIRTRTVCDQKLLQGSKVRFIASATAGHDHIDTAWCEAHDIAWYSASGCNSGSVAQYVVSALVYFSRKYHFSLRNKTIGIIGVGNVGEKVAAISRILGMQTVLNDPPRARKIGSAGFVSLDTLLSCADIVTLHVPLTFHSADRTFHMACASFFSKINKDSLFINTSRGEIVDTLALKNALKSEILADAACDVWENEPHIDRELLDLTSLATPHIAGYSIDGKAEGTAMSVRAVSNFFALGLDNWYPGTIPQPLHPVLRIDAFQKSEQEVLSEAIEATYDISIDDALFRKNPDTFEWQRGNYPQRREFKAYTVELKNGSPKVYGKLKRMGFSVILC